MLLYEKGLRSVCLYRVQRVAMKPYVNGDKFFSFHNTVPQGEAVSVW